LRLQNLDLRICKGVNNLTPLAGLHELQNLILWGTSVADLIPLAELPGLLSLNLCLCENLMDLAPLAGLQCLQNLDLSRIGVTDLASLVGLQGLQSLDLSNTRVTDLVPLAGLQGLQTLDLSNTGVNNLGPLAELQELQRLHLPRTGVTDLAPLAGLQELQGLDLSGTGVTDLAPLTGLQGLQGLNLSSTGVTDLAPLAGLQGLQRLGLSSTGVTDLAPLAGLKELRSLDLSSMGVTDLAPLVGLQELRSLNMTRSGVADLALLAGLQRLQSLDLYDCRPPIQAEFLQVFAEHPRLLKLVATEAVGVPREVLSHHLNDNCLPRLRAYLAEIDLGAEAENEVKVILLGNGRVGKTQLCRRFRSKPFDESVESTHGVQIWREELRIRAGDQEQVFQVNWWDFGGQDIYHGTHALFLRSRAVFLILWNPQLENRAEFNENGITLRNQPLAYWLNYVRTLAGEDSPVIVVQSQCDRFEERRSGPVRPDGFGFFESCSYSARTDLGQEILEAHLRDAMRYLLERNGALKIGRGRAEVRRRLYDWRGEDQKREPEGRQHRTLTTDELRTLCDEVGGIVSWEHALDYFHHTGVVFYRPDLFSNRIILDQDWALDAIYTVFHRGRTAPWLRDSGRFTREDLALLAWQEHSLEEQRLFLGLMESCGVCFPCGKTAQGETRYVAPDLLPRFEAVAGRLHAWKDEPDTPTLRLEYRFFHPAVIRGLMSRIGQQAGDLAEYWKYGLWLKDGRRDAQLLVQFKDTSTDEEPGAGALELKAQGRDPLGLLSEIRKSIIWRRIGEKPDDELLTLKGTTVARSALATVIDGRALDVQSNPAAAAPFTAFFENREHDPAEAIDITPQALAESEKRREVFISYAWGDDTPEGKIRAEACDRLYDALEKDGFRPVRDRNEMQPGERISAFIRRLTHADLVVAVISDKYLRSPYCMFEIYKLWQKHQGDADALLQCLVPIVLPEVKVGNVRERLPYLEYWADQADSLEALIRNPKLRPSTESWEEVRLVREFAHHVDGILVFLQDVLMPRKLETHLDDGFQKVREALRRRMGEAV
jgi:internalin A